MRLRSGTDPTQEPRFRLQSRLAGPLPGPIQATPAAETYGLLMYVVNLVDSPGMVYYTDCAWVVSSFEGGRAATSGATSEGAMQNCEG